MPRLQNRIKDLEAELAAAVRRNRALDVFKAADLGNVGMKTIIQKLTGDPKDKFEVDHKMTAEQFVKLVTRLSSVGSDDDVTTDVEIFENICSVFQRAISEAGEPFKGDLENETFKSIQAAFRAFDPSE